MSQTILPHRLPHALDGVAGLSVLSLDCFDTLLWRDTNAPTDLFALLGAITPDQRIRGEATARKTRLLDHRGSGEVTLREIYAALLPHADAATREALVAHECAVEARHCFAFTPTVALMREAKRRGLKIFVVSDTYLERDQLEALIRAAAGDAVADMIDRIFCSCEHRRAKAEGLFDIVLRKTAVRADRILHVGDNPRADLAAATRHGLRARHLVQFAAPTVQRLRQEAAAGTLIAGGGVAFQPHRPILAIGEPQIDDPAEAFGFATLGPVMAGFARWTAREADALAQAGGGTVHPLFLMRDGHLPARMFAALFPDRTGHPIEISRFTATAAAMRRPEAVRRFIIDEIGDAAGRDFLRQLLITEDEADALIAQGAAADGAYTIAATLQDDAWVERIAARGRAFADELIAYIRAQVAPAPGDTLMLVDLGYNGSVQNQVDALLAEAFDCAVAGRYLLLSETLPSGLDKHGMIDRTRYDADALATIMASISVLEQLCTTAQGSVIGYADGASIRSEPGIKGRQSDIRDRAQAGCVRFAAAARDAVLRPTDDAGIETDHRAAAAALARLLFLPLPHELDLLARFEHDANLGTDQMVTLFDPDAATRGLREGGLFYLKNTQRMYLPAELRGQGLPTSLAYLVQRRFGLDLRYVDFCDRGIDVPVLVVDGTEAFADQVRATPTHDGYHVAAIPVGACRYAVGVQFGRDHEWVQIQSARFLPVAAFLAGDARTDALAIPALPSCEGMDQVAPHLFHCAGPDAFLMVPPPPGPHDGTPMMLTVVFRPIAAREPVTAPPALSDTPCEAVA
jgi:FMN phosphatase YigB (HAD superfamily)